MKTIRKLEIEKVIREIKEALRSSRIAAHRAACADSCTLIGGNFVIVWLDFTTEDHFFAIYDEDGEVVKAATKIDDAVYNTAKVSCSALQDGNFMETANFSDMNQKLTILKQKEVTEFIKNRTRLYRDAWITAPLERALKILEEEINRK